MPAKLANATKLLLECSKKVIEIMSSHLSSSSNSVPKDAQNVSNSLRVRTPFANIENIDRKLYCTLCQKNGEPPEVYESHNLKFENGRIACPVLRRHICDLCGATGDHAHTRSHCPKFVFGENSRPKPAFRILSSGKATRVVNHK